MDNTARSNRITITLLTLWSISIPLSTALMNVTGILLMLWTIFSYRRVNYRTLFSSTLMKAWGLWFGYFLVHWLITHPWDWEALRKITHWCLYPCLLLLLETVPNTRTWLIRIFIGIMAFSALMGIYRYYSGSWFWHVYYTDAAVFKDHIKTNFLMSFALYLALFETEKHRWVWGLVALFLFYGFGLSLGRVGYVLMPLFAMLWGWQKYQFKGVIYTALISWLLMGLSFALSPVFFERMRLMLCQVFYQLWPGASEVSWCQTQMSALSEQATPSSMGYRFAFIQYSLLAFLQHPWLGWGTGQFATAYDAVLPIEQHIFRSDNPHNQYLLVAVEHGLFGLALFLNWFKCQIQLLWHRATSIHHLSYALVLGYFVAGLFTSLVMDLTEMNFWMWGLALAFPLKELKHVST